MPDEKNMSRRDFLRISIGCALALDLEKFALFSDESVKADYILYGAPVLTADSTNSIMNALAIKDNRILALAKNLSDIKPFRGSETKILKVPGGCITPGMIDGKIVCQDPSSGIVMEKS